MASSRWPSKLRRAANPRDRPGQMSCNDGQYLEIVSGLSILIPELLLGQMLATPSKEICSFESSLQYSESQPERGIGTTLTCYRISSFGRISSSTCLPRSVVISASATTSSRVVRKFTIHIRRTYVSFRTALETKACPPFSIRP